MANAGKRKPATSEDVRRIIEGLTPEAMERMSFRRLVLIWSALDNESRAGSEWAEVWLRLHGDALRNLLRQHAQRHVRRTRRPQHVTIVLV